MIKEATTEDLSSPLDIISASRDELNVLPGVGPAMADRIIAARPFSSSDDMQRVDGLGPVMLERRNPLIIISDPKVECEKPPEESVQVESDRIKSQVGDDKFEQESELGSQDVIISSSEEGEAIPVEQIPGEGLDPEVIHEEQEEESITDGEDSDVGQAETEEIVDSRIEMVEEMGLEEESMPHVDDSQPTME